MRDVAKRCRISVTPIWNAEHGVEIHPRNAKKICDVLGLDMEKDEGLVIPVEDDGNAA